MRREYNSVFVPEDEYFTVEVETPGILRYNTDSWITSAATLQYSKNGGTWTTIVPNTGDTGAISVVAGDKIAWKGINSAICTSISYRCSFCASTCTYKISGNIMSLLAGDDFKNAYFVGCGQYYTDPGLDCFTKFFYNCTGLTDASNLALPASGAWARPYYGMFSACTNLVHAPKEIGLTMISGGSEAMRGMFAGCTSLVDAPEIKVTSLYGYNTSNEFDQMFEGCTSLVKPPSVLPLLFDTVGSAHTDTYRLMFAGCTSLTYGPELPSTYLNRNCYYGMFSGCTSLTTAPNLPANFNQMWHAPSAYYCMFNNCTSLVNAPIMSGAATDSQSHYCMFAGCTSLKNVQSALTAHNIFGSCYEGMFSGCTSLVKAPDLKATSLTIGNTAGTYCYKNMFKGCTKLTSPPVLCATTMVVGCYSGMFQGCTSLATAPALRSTALANYCYENMFWNCTNLTSAPTLPATTMASNCYLHMFTSCTKLTTAPALLAITLAPGCYNYMFTSCSKINYVKCIASATTGTYLSASTQSWTSGVATSGTFVKHTNVPQGRNGWPSNVSDFPTGSGIPSNWTVQNATS
jgi:hypothetical protein